MFIYHITEASTWQRAILEGNYSSTSFHDEGFIHCSNKDQVIKVADTYYKNAVNLVLLKMDTRLLEVPLVYENLEGKEELFPHVYGKINLNAVVEARPLLQNEEGIFHFPEFSL